MDCVCHNILHLDPQDVDVINNLKNKTACEFMDLLKKVEKGYRPDYEFILEEVSLLGIHNEIDKREFVLHYYLTNPWETMIS